MRILYLNRAKKEGRHSIEELFSTIKDHIRSFCSVEDFHDKTYTNFYKNLKAVKNISADIYHITGGIGYYAIFLPSKKTILTVHDTNHYEFDLSGLRKWLFGMIFYQIPIKNVKYVTVVSNHTKSRLVDLFSIPENKIKVIPNCYPNNYKKKIKPNLSSPIKLLQIGTKENKNLNRLFDAISGLKINLTIIGKLNNDQLNSLKKNSINYTNKLNLTNSEIHKEYLKCDIVTLISLSEGFGLPIIEANAVGRVVITSNISSMPEVTGNAGVLVNPYNIVEIRTQIKKIIENKEFRNSLIENGFENILRYTPEKIASYYMDIYTEMIT